MHKIGCLLWTLAAAASILSAGAEPVRLVFDTDISPDFDDVGAMAVMHKLADDGEAEILATVACNRTPLCVPVVEIINAHYGRAAIPVGGVREGGVSIDDQMHAKKWPEELAKKYAADIRHKTSAEAPGAVAVYRKALAAAPDGSVTVCAVGFLTNLADLLESSPDDLSPLNGRDLVARKVKALYTMAGYEKGGREFNVYMDAVSSKKVFDRWPTKIVVSPAELGNQIRTGKRLAAQPDTRSPVRDAFALALSQADRDGRQSWDETTVYAAIRGGRDLFSRVRGRFVVTDEQGNNTWTPDPNGPHELLKLAASPARAAEALEDLMIRPRRGEIAGRKMAWAHYVPWIKPENASLAAENFYNFHLTTVDERESRLISTRREIELALANGIDGWLVDLGANPPNSRFNSSWDMPDYLNAAKGTPFMVAICLDGIGSAEYVAAEVVRMLKDFGNHPNYAKMNGRPVLSTFTFLHALQRRSRMMNLVRQAGFNPYLVANANPWPWKSTDFPQLEPYLDAFDAVYMFDAPGHAKDPPEVTNRELRDWCAAHGKLAVPSLHPGYLGGWLSGNNDYYHPFRGMDMLYRMYESAKSIGPSDWIHVTTWNDLVETALMPCVFTPGVTRLTKEYCESLKGRAVADDDTRLNFAYHREELVGTMLRIEAMLLPRQTGSSVTVDGVLLGRDGEKVGKLEPRELSGTGFVRCEWLVPTAALSEHPSLTPCFRVAGDGVPPQTALLPSVNLVTGWIRNQVTVNVPFDGMLADFRPAVSVTQAGDVLTATLAGCRGMSLKRAILFRNDRPFAVFKPDSSPDEYERVIRMDGVDQELALSVSNGRILRAVKNFERNGCWAWQWNATNLVTRSCPKWSLHGIVVSGGRGLKLSFDSKSAPRLAYDGPDLTVMNAPPIGRVDGLLTVRRQSPAPKVSDGFWAFVETESGKFHYTPVVYPFDADRRLVERSILETTTSLETSCGCSGYALRDSPEFLTPTDRLPVAGNRIVKCRVPVAGSRHAEWDLSSRKGVFELPRRVWPQGTQRISLKVKPEAGHPVRQSLVHMEGWSDGVTLDLTADGKVEMGRHFRVGLQTVCDRATGSRPLQPGQWHELVVEGDMDEIRLLVDGKVDARMTPTPVRCMEQCRVYVGGAKDRTPFFGARGRLAIGGL